MSRKMALFVQVTIERECSIEENFNHNDSMENIAILSFKQRMSKTKVLIKENKLYCEGNNMNIIDPWIHDISSWNGFGQRLTRGRLETWTTELHIDGMLSLLVHEWASLLLPGGNMLVKRAINKRDGFSSKVLTLGKESNQYKRWVSIQGAMYGKRAAINRRDGIPSKVLSIGRESSKQSTGEMEFHPRCFSQYES